MSAGTGVIHRKRRSTIKQYARYAALLGALCQSLRNFILMDIIGQATGDLTWDAIAQHFPEIAEHDPDDAAIAPAIAALSAEHQQFLAAMKAERSEERRVGKECRS